jgi:hypothetical protein
MFDSLTIQSTTRSAADGWSCFPYGIQLEFRRNFRLSTVLEEFLSEWDVV